MICATKLRRIADGVCLIGATQVLHDARPVVAMTLFYQTLSIALVGLLVVGLI
jgi:hypothetical protein